MPSKGNDLCPFHAYQKETEQRVAFMIWALKRSPCASQMQQDVPAMRAFLCSCLYEPGDKGLLYDS